MAADTPTSVPAEITQGDTLKFSLALADYPASDGWVLSFAFASDQLNFSFTTSADPAAPDSHLASVAPAATGQWTSGRYAGRGRVTYGGETFTVWTGSLCVLSQFAAIADTRSHARKVLDAINAMLEGTAGNELASSTIENESLTWKSTDDLLKLRDRYQLMVNREEEAARIAHGLGGRKRILTRFSSPR